MNIYPKSVFIALFSFFLVLQGSADAYAQRSQYQKKQFEPFLTRGKTTWSISTGLRNNNTDWADSSDATGTATPNIFIQNTFGDVSFIEVKAKVRHVEPADIAFIKGGIQAEAEITGGIVADGFSQVSTFAGDNRTLETNRVSTNNLGGAAIGGAVSLGYKINLTGTPAYKAHKILSSPHPKTARGRLRKDRALRDALRTPGPYISITPLAGYGIDQQSYDINDAFELIPNFESRPTKTDYVTNWRGPFFGLEGEIKNKKHMLRLRGQYHDLNYDATWTDNVQPKDILEQEADGEGVTLNAEYAYALADDYALTFEGFFQSRNTDPGTEKQTIAGVPLGTVLLHEIDDESHALRVGLRYNWGD